MTELNEQTNADLIAGARQLIRHSSVSTPEHAKMLGRLADALEAADQRPCHHQNSAYLRMMEERDEAAQRVAEYAAVVEKVRAETEELRRQGYPVGVLLRILATTPADALAEHDAKVRAEALRDAAEALTFTVSDITGYKYQALATEELLDMADRIEKEAGQ